MKRYVRASVNVATASAVALAMSAAYAAGKNLVDTAKEAGGFNTLLTAAEKAGIVDKLKGKGPYTLFAPSDEAFAKIPKEELDKLLADKQALAKVLNYHLVSGKVLAKDVKAGEKKTVEGEMIKVTTTDGVKVNDAKVVKTDVLASNGVIHVIDTVIMPKKK
jgi:uncharacterized surface protein with fasciclin (FAS1) repeats